MPDFVVVRRKLNSLTGYLDELATLADCSLAEYQRKFERRHAIEKLIELAVEYAIEINRGVIEAADRTPPQTYYNTFIEMEKLGIWPDKLTSHLASTTGLRNRLVHRYDEIDNTAVYHSLKPLLKHYRQYVRLIETHIAEKTRPKQKTKKK